MCQVCFGASSVTLQGRTTDVCVHRYSISDVIFAIVIGMHYADEQKRLQTGLELEHNLAFSHFSAQRELTEHLQKR